MRRTRKKGLNAKCEQQSDLIELWKRRMVTEKGYSENTAMCITQRLQALTKYMQYGHAIIAYYKQDGTFQLVTGTLISYPREFHHPHDMLEIHSTFVFWCIEASGWRTFQIENFLDWKPVV